MKDRLTTLAYALTAFILSIFLLVPPQHVETPISLPTTEDNGPAGIKGVYRWLENNNIVVHSLRHPFTELNQLDNLAPIGNILFLSMPQQNKAFKTEWSALQQWIRQGNTVFILGAGYFKPEWAGGKNCFCAINKLLKGFELKISANEEVLEETPENNKIQSLNQQVETFKQTLNTFKPKDTWFQPQSKHVLMQQVTSVQGKITDVLLEKQWGIKSQNNLVFKLFTVPQQEGLTIMWQMEAGAGQIFLSLTPNIFSNKMLNQVSNARFLSNILNQSLSEKGVVVFDDYHFGLSHLYDPGQFYKDPRLHKTLGFLALLWLLYVIGYSNRLAPVRKTLKKPSVSDFVDAMASFFSRHLDTKTVAKTLTQQLIQDIRLRRNLTDDQSAWQWLHQHPSLKTSDISLLQQAEQKNHLSLHKLTDTITAIRKTIFL